MMDRLHFQLLPPLCLSPTPCVSTKYMASLCMSVVDMRARIRYPQMSPTAHQTPINYMRCVLKGIKISPSTIRDRYRSVIRYTRAHSGHPTRNKPMGTAGWWIRQQDTALSTISCVETNRICICQELFTRWV